MLAERKEISGCLQDQFLSQEQKARLLIIFQDKLSELVSRRERSFKRPLNSARVVELQVIIDDIREKGSTQFAKSYLTETLNKLYPKISFFENAPVPLVGFEIYARKQSYLQKAGWAISTLGIFDPKSAFEYQNNMGINFVQERHPVQSIVQKIRHTAGAIRRRMAH